MEDVFKHYLTYFKPSDHGFSGHATIFIVYSTDPVQAIWQYLLNYNPDLVANDDLSFIEDKVKYPHPLAYVESWFKTDGEWQIRELPSFPFPQNATEVFCGESDDGPAEVIKTCRKKLLKDSPRSRARAFVWYVKKRGALVTFYTKSRHKPYEVAQRYLWDWDGHTESVDTWTGDYRDLMAALDLRGSWTPSMLSGDKSLHYGAID